jgi:hypothetical protein
LRVSVATPSATSRSRIGSPADLAGWAVMSAFSRFSGLC